MKKHYFYSRPYLTISGEDRLNSAENKERNYDADTLTTTTEEDTRDVYPTVREHILRNKTDEIDEHDDIQGAASGIIVPLSKSLG